MALDRLYHMQGIVGHFLAEQKNARTWTPSSAGSVKWFSGRGPHKGAAPLVGLDDGRQVVEVRHLVTRGDHHQRRGQPGGRRFPMSRGLGDSKLDCGFWEKRRCCRKLDLNPPTKANQKELGKS